MLSDRSFDYLPIRFIQQGCLLLSSKKKKNINKERQLETKRNRTIILSYEFLIHWEAIKKKKKNLKRLCVKFSNVFSFLFHHKRRLLFNLKQHCVCNRKKPKLQMNTIEKELLFFISRIQNHMTSTSIQ